MGPLSMEGIQDCFGLLQPICDHSCLHKKASGGTLLWKGNVTNKDNDSSRRSPSLEVFKARLDGALGNLV